MPTIQDQRNPTIKYLAEQVHTVLTVRSKGRYVGLLFREQGLRCTAATSDRPGSGRFF